MPDAQLGLVAGFGMVTYDRCLCTGAVILGRPAMTMPLMRPKRKNPVLRTRQMNLPPGARGRVALGITAAAAEGRFELQTCEDCGTVQYPPREACHNCLSPRLHWREQAGDGRAARAAPRCITATTCSSASGCPGAWAWCTSMPARR